MKRNLAIIIGLFMSVVVFGQDLTVDEAMATMKELSTKYLKGEFTRIDATGIDQYVDVTVTKVYSFRDYSYGNLMHEFVEYINTRPAGLGNYDLKAENIRKIDYVNENQTKIAAYSAIVDYDGLTKFGETVKMSSLFFFNWKGEPIAARPVAFDINEYRAKLAVWMEKKVIKDLSEMQDPLFKKEKWISETAYTTGNGNQYEMKYCFILDRGENESGLSGPFKTYYYQIQTSSSQIKSVTLITGRFTEIDGKISFDYKKASVTTYHVLSEYSRSFQVGDFSSIDNTELEISIISSTRATKMVRNSSSIPVVFEYVDPSHLRMTMPFDSQALNFTKE